MNKNANNHEKTNIPSIIERIGGMEFKRDSMRRTLICLACAMLMITPPIFLGLDPTENARADEIERTWPASVSVAYGTASGILDYVVGQDGTSYSVAEEDVNAGRSYTNTTLSPNGVGTHTEFDDVQPVPTDHYEAVDEGSPHDGNVTYLVETFGGGNEWSNDTYETEDLSMPSGDDTVHEVRVYGWARNEFLAGPPEENQYAVCVYSGTTLDCDTLAWTGYVYSEFTHTWTTNPDDSASWEDADVDAIEIGHQVFWPGAGAGPDSWATLVYAEVETSAPIDDYRATFEFTFTGIDKRRQPKLEVSGYQSGDAEGIRIQVSRAGSWTTLTSNAFTSTLTTVQYPLSTSDLIGNTASIRIIDTDNTDDTQTTIYIDEILILAGGEPPNPSSPIEVYTKSEYKLWENRLKVSLWWEQTGGPETATAISKWVYVWIDGNQMGGGVIPVKDGFVHVGVPWNALDGGMHNATVIGYVLINWTSGSVAYQSDPEKLTMDNFPRWLVLVIIFIIVLIAVVATVIHIYDRRRAYEVEEEE